MIFWVRFLGMGFILTGTKTVIRYWSLAKALRREEKQKKILPQTRLRRSYGAPSPRRQTRTQKGLNKLPRFRSQAAYLKTPRSKATGNLHRKEQGLFYIRSLPPQQAAGSALA